MADVITRLRDARDADWACWELRLEAADEIERLKVALQAFRYAKMWIGADSYDGIDPRARELLDDADVLADIAGAPVRSIY